MKSFVLAAAPLLVASSTLARSPLRRGSTTDICANLDVDLVMPDVDDKPYVAGHIDIGLCISQVKMFVDHYNVIEAATKAVGVDEVEAVIIDLIKKAGVECSYPPHATPSVTSRNECDFVRKDGFLAMPTNQPSSCMCPIHLKECEGECGHFSLGCHETRPPSRRENDPKCAENLAMCGVPDTMAGKAYKCINITSDSSTCGGCVKASPFGGPSPDGVDCREIPNVDQVSCLNGGCVVRTCKSSFTVSPSKEACIPNIPGKSTRALPIRSNGQVLDSTPITLVQGETETITSDGEVPRIEVGLTHQSLSAAGVGTRAPRACGVDDSQC